MRISAFVENINCCVTYDSFKPIYIEMTEAFICTIKNILWRKAKFIILIVSTLSVNHYMYSVLFIWSGAVMVRSIVRLGLRQNANQFKSTKNHPIPRPHGRAMGCRL